MKLFKLDWLDLNFQNQENGLSPDAVCAISVSLAGDETTYYTGENIDGQHLRPPVLAILLETIERENSDGLPNL